MPRYLVDPMVLSFLHLADLVFVTLTLSILYSLFSQTRRRAPLLPGPKGLPLIGNVLDMPTQQEWKTFTQWGETWGTHSPFGTDLAS